MDRRIYDNQQRRKKHHTLRYGRSGGSKGSLLGTRSKHHMRNKIGQNAYARENKQKRMRKAENQTIYTRATQREPMSREGKLPAAKKGGKRSLRLYYANVKRGGKRSKSGKNGQKEETRKNRNARTRPLRGKMANK